MTTPQSISTSPILFPHHNLPPLHSTRGPFQCLMTTIVSTAVGVVTTNPDYLHSFCKQKGQIYVPYDKEITSLKCSIYTQIEATVLRQTANKQKYTLKLGIYC